MPGDLVFILEVKNHPFFKRDKNNNLYCHKRIKLSEALTGVEFKLIHLDKRVLIVKSKEGEVIKPGGIKQIDNEGMPTHRNPFQKGNLYVKFSVEFPKKMPIEICRQLRKILPTNLQNNVQPSEDDEEVFLTEPVFTEEKKQRQEVYMEDEEEPEEGAIQCGQQ